MPGAGAEIRVMAVKVFICNAVVMFALLLPVFADNSYANGPMPYTEEALNKLNGAMEKIKPPADGQGDDDHAVRSYVNTYRKIFATAGYDYEQSMIRIINDIRSDKYVVNKTTITLNRLVRELLKLHVKTGINPNKYLNKECAELLMQFRDLIRSNMKKYGSC